LRYHKYHKLGRRRRGGQGGQSLGETLACQDSLIMILRRPCFARVKTGQGGCRPFGMVRPILGVMGRCPLGVSQVGPLARRDTPPRPRCARAKDRPHRRRDRRGDGRLGRVRCLSAWQYPTLHYGNRAVVALPLSVPGRGVAGGAEDKKRRYI